MCTLHTLKWPKPNLLLGTNQNLYFSISGPSFYATPLVVITIVTSVLARWCSHWICVNTKRSGVSEHQNPILHMNVAEAHLVLVVKCLDC